MADSQQLFGLFSPETGLNLRRSGAALGGRLPQFEQQQLQQQQVQAAQQQTLSDERKQAMLLDNRGALRALRAGRPQDAVALFQNRIQDINTLGGDPTHSMQILSMLEQGNTDEVLAGLEQIDNRAVDEGIFKPLDVPGGPGSLVVKASEILPNGSVIQSTSEGVRVFNAQGEQLHGQDVVDTIEAGRKLGVSVAGDTAAAKAEADRVKQGIKLSGELFGQIGPIRQSLRTIGKARQALAEGAETGAIDKFLPNIRESSIKLGNLMNKLGLEIISGTTFGALSEGELRLALDTALPTGLQPEALDRWLADKEVAQTKLLSELNDDIQVLSDGGTIGQIAARREAQRTATTEQPGNAAQGGLPQGVTEEDIQTTMRANNMTREQVMQRLQGGQ